MKETKELWNKIQAISTAFNAIFGAIAIIALQTQIFETSIVLITNWYAWPILIWTTASRLIT